jgi:hypothetical protein
MMLHPDSELPDVRKSNDAGTEDLSTLRTGILTMARDVVSAEQSSYSDRMKAHMLAVRRAYDALDPAERISEGPILFDALFEFFLSQEDHADGSDAFTLKDFHNAIVRDFDNPDFHQAMMAHFMSRETRGEMPGTREHRSLSMKAREFDANGVRRRGFHQVEKGNTDVGMDMVTRARTTFGEVLGYWEDVGDLQSQARVLYELAHIAEQTQDYKSAAVVQEKSALLATEADDLVGALIASIKKCEAQYKGNLDDLSHLIQSLGLYASMMEGFAAEGHTTAKAWVGNAHAHLAEVQEAAQQIDAAIASWKVVAEDPEVNAAASLRQLKERAPREIERLTTLPR